MPTFLYAHSPLNIHASGSHRERESHSFSLTEILGKRASFTHTQVTLGLVQPILCKNVFCPISCYFLAHLFTPFRHHTNDMGTSVAHVCPKAQHRTDMVAKLSEQVLPLSPYMLIWQDSSSANWATKLLAPNVLVIALAPTSLSFKVDSLQKLLPIPNGIAQNLVFPAFVPSLHNQKLEKFELWEINSVFVHVLHVQHA